MLRWVLLVWLDLEGWWTRPVAPEQEGGYIDPSGQTAFGKVCSWRADD